jgi:hypothetical protein
MFMFPKGPLKSKIMSFIHFCNELCKNGDSDCCNVDERAWHRAIVIKKKKLSIS